MNHLVVLGAGTAGTMAANTLRRRLDRRQWAVTVVEPRQTHYYQPGYLFIPFGGDSDSSIARPVSRQLGRDIELIQAEVDRVDAAAREVCLTNGQTLAYDYLIVATGVSPRPDQTPGMLDGGQWRKSIFDFYTYDGAVALQAALRRFAAGVQRGEVPAGRLVVHVVDVPIKCPVAPLEFVFLADAYLRERGVRDQVELVYATPLPGAFTKPVASHRLGSMLDERKILLESDFLVERVDGQRLVSYDEREIPFDLLVTVPLNMGADFVGRSGLGDELNLVHVDRETMQSTVDPRIFVLGDANDLPTSKAGSVAHFAVETFANNFLHLVHGEPMTDRFDGHANCFVESGDGRALLLDFNYDTQPLPGHYPLPGVGPLSLLTETRRNHWGKLAFRWLYWHVLLPGRKVPLPAHMSMAGKHPEE